MASFKGLLKKTRTHVGERVQFVFSLCSWGLVSTEHPRIRKESKWTRFSPSGKGYHAGDKYLLKARKGVRKPRRL